MSYSRLDLNIFSKRPRGNLEHSPDAWVLEFQKFSTWRVFFRVQRLFKLTVLPTATQRKRGLLTEQTRVKQSVLQLTTTTQQSGNWILVLTEKIEDNLAVEA